jgi:cold shock CspA family protein
MHVCASKEITMQIGKVVGYDKARAFGFIEYIAVRPRTVFFHINFVKDRLILQIGDEVSFDIEPSPVKPGQTHAVNVTLLLPEPVTRSEDGNRRSHQPQAFRSSL